MSDMDQTVYDDIVVGAGSSGAVIAARLSEDPARKVLLIEAGPDYPDPAAMPPELLDARAPVMAGHNWRIGAHVNPAGLMHSLVAAGATFLHADASSRRGMASAVLAAGAAPAQPVNAFDYVVGKLVGGSSAINSAAALRGQPDDYDDWARSIGDPCWSWNELLPLFKAIESDHDAAADYHGRSGPVPIRREADSELTPLQKAFVDACLGSGYPACGDLNAPDADGVGILPKCVRDGRRMSSALTHLAAARARPNLRILPHALVDRLAWDGARRCTGVEAIVGAARRILRAERVILCAGAINTPCILQRSGAGNQQLLERLGIAVRIALPGVGDNLADHPMAGIWATPAAGASHFGETVHQAMLRCADIQFSMVGGFRTSQIPSLAQALGSPIGAAVVVSLGRPVSRGAVAIASADPARMPTVLTHCLQEPQDMSRMKAGARMAWEIIQHPMLRSRLHRIFAWNSALLSTEGLLEKALTTFTRPSWHAAGTARMGSASDRAAVVDSRGRLFGADNVWIADASIMPSLPSAPLHLSCVLIAERIAAWIR